MVELKARLRKLHKNLNVLREKPNKSHTKLLSRD